MNTFLMENPVWSVELSNGQSVISDNEYIGDKGDWERLKDYCHADNLQIKSMSLSFRDHHVSIPQAKHYYFRRMILCVLANGKNYNYFIAGSTNNTDKVIVNRYLVPAMLIVETEERLLSNDPSLI